MPVVSVKVGLQAVFPRKTNFTRYLTEAIQREKLNFCGETN